MSQPTPYDRPNDRWRCGRAGTPCAHGPNERGQCPLHGAADRAQRCRPRRTLRALRARWLRGAAVFTVGATLMLLGAKGRNELLVPGPLTSHHAQVIARDNWENRCATCHPNANQGPGAWLASAVSGEEHGVAQATLCLDCHRDLSADGLDPLLAHGLPADALHRVMGDRDGAASTLGSSAEHPIACAVCHQEHHGATHDLTAITDARCQACHSQRYDSFADDHPDFGLWPTQRRTRIAFNHATHQGDHFAKANRSFDCRACHLNDATGDLTIRADYQAACADCHERGIVESFGDGVDFLALPTLDTDALAEADRAVSAWPADQDGDFDGELPAFTKLLLAADPDAERAIGLLGADFSFFDVDADDPAMVTAAADVVDALVRLIEETQEEGHGALSYRVGRLLGERAPPEADLVARLPIELIDELQATWFAGRSPAEPFDAIEDRRTGGAWSLDHQRFALRYRPSGHDDPWLRAWLDAVVGLPDDRSELREAMLTSLKRPGAPGGCLTCHSVERAATRGLVINWRGRERLTEPQGFTRFSHRPHLSQPELADCTACHRIESATKAIAYSGEDPSHFASEFAPLGKASCVACHQPHAAGDSCTQCHNYHVGGLPGVLAPPYDRRFQADAAPQRAASVH